MTLVTAVARIGGICQRRSNMPKIAKQPPAATNSRSPTTPLEPIVCSASAPMTQGRRASPRRRQAARRQRLLEHQPAQDEAAERGAGRLDQRAVAERHQHVTEIAEQRERQAAGRARARSPGRNRPQSQVAKAVRRHHRQQQQSGPDKAMQRDARAAKARGHALSGRDEAAAQHSAAPAPQATPQAVGCAIVGRGEDPSGALSVPLDRTTRKSYETSSPTKRCGRSREAAKNFVN